ncbi:MAG: metalloregulator ArsR/SmtB family transcription factor [Clostridia bacterium]
MQLIDKKTQSEVEYYLPDTSTATKLAAFFDMFSDITRVRILSALSVSEMCVNDIALLLGMNQTTLSHQLRLLRDNGIVETIRQGKTVFYCVNDKNIHDLLMYGAEFCFK